MKLPYILMIQKEQIQKGYKKKQNSMNNFGQYLQLERKTSKASQRNKYLIQ